MIPKALERKTRVLFRALHGILVVNQDRVGHGFVVSGSVSGA
jgi:hypothetical protein